MLTTVFPIFPDDNNIFKNVDYICLQILAYCKILEIYKIKIIKIIFVY